MLTTRRGEGTRPLAARVKASLFEILSVRLSGATFYDLFAGNGAVGIEALSRGAARAVFIEQNPACVRIIRENLKRCGYEGRAEVHQADVLRMIPLLPFPPEGENIVFLGPPYDSGYCHESLQCLGRNEVLGSALLVIAEVRKKKGLLSRYGSLGLVRDKYYGETRLAFFETIGAEE